MAQWRSRRAAADAAGVAGVLVADRPDNAVVEEDRADWDQFDPDLYVNQNYVKLEADDRMIVQIMRDFFCANADAARPDRHAIDVGSGANLYPALAMLPFCGRIDLREYGRKNVDWLRREVQEGYSTLWDPYWRILAKRAPYERIESPRQALRRVTQVQRRSIFRLPAREWDMGTMSFVAESISDKLGVFNLATERFIGSLKQGAPFAAAFMRDSSGYYVGPVRFPAVAIQEADVEQCLVPLSHDLQIITVRSEGLRRTGYHNMIVATGRAGRKRR